MKKGFTLVELAIVLVVIGLLMGMAFKGKALVEAARIKAEVNKIQKISTAVNVYYSKFDTLPGLTVTQVPGGIMPGGYPGGSAGAVAQALVNDGLLKHSDFKLGTGATSWVFIGCREGPNGATWQGTTIDERHNLCLFGATGRNEGFNATWWMNVAAGDILGRSVSLQTICQLETLLDDSSVGSGDARRAEGQTMTAITGVWDCSDKTRFPETATEMAYLIRVY